MKRTFDFTASLLGLIALSPFLLIIAVFVIIYHGLPVFFRQKRPGLHGEPFYLIKFRSMTNETDERGNLLPNEKRLTRFGKFLRSTSLDEFPELINVIKGEMSLVGPRPLLMEYLPRYNDFQKRRMEAKPGITGWSQINGRNTLTWDDKFKLDVWYVDNQSFWLDLQILLKTCFKVLKREGISHQGDVAMPHFYGNKKDE